MASKHGSRSSVALRKKLEHFSQDREPKADLITIAAVAPNGPPQAAPPGRPSPSPGPQQAIPNGKPSSPFAASPQSQNQQLPVAQGQQAPSTISSKDPKAAAQAASDMRNVVRRKLTGYVGFANLPNQWHRKSVRKGFNFNVMVVGMSFRL